MGYVDLGSGLGGEHERRGGRRVLGARRGAGDAGQGCGHPVVDDPGGERVVLAVEDHRQARRPGVEHPVAQDPGRGRAQAVVRDAEGPGLPQEAHLRQALSRKPDVEGCRDASPHPRLMFDPAHETADDHGTVHDRVGVRHHNDARKTAGGGRRRAALYGLLVLAARRAPVGVHVHEAGEEVQAIGVELARPAQTFADLGYPP